MIKKTSYTTFEERIEKWPDRLVVMQIHAYRTLLDSEKDLKEAMIHKSRLTALELLYVKRKGRKMP